MIRIAELKRETSRPQCFESHLLDWAAFKSHGGCSQYLGEPRSRPCTLV